MPLLSGADNIGKNITELKQANKSKSSPRPMRQIIAIALHQAYGKKK